MSVSQQTVSDQFFLLSLISGENFSQVQTACDTLIHELSTEEPRSFSAEQLVELMRFMISTNGGAKLEDVVGKFGYDAVAQWIERNILYFNPRGAMKLGGGKQESGQRGHVGVESVSFLIAMKQMLVKQVSMNEAQSWAEAYNTVDADEASEAAHAAAKNAGAAAKAAGNSAGN